MESKRTVGDKCSSRHDEDKRAKPTPKPLHPLSHQNQEAEVRRKKRGLRGRSPFGKTKRQPCKNFLKSTCTKSPCDYWHPPECQFYKSESGCRFGDKCSFPHRQLEGQPGNKLEYDGDKSAVAILKNVRQLGCVFQDIEQPKSSSILRKGPKVLGPIRRVQVSKATQRHANIRESRGPSLGVIQLENPRQRSPYVVKFEDRSQKDTERQQRCARGDAWRMAKSILKIKEKDKATFLSLTEVWCLPAPSVMKPEEREFVVDSGASMHMLSRTDLNSNKLVAVKVSKSPTTVVPANGEVQTKEKATVYVKELDLLVTVGLLEDTLAVLSLGKLCEDHGYSFEWTSGQKPQLIKDGRRLKSSTENYVPIVVLVYGQALQVQLHRHLQTQYCRKQYFLRCTPHQQEVRVRVAQYGVARCVICQNSWKS